MDKYIGKTFGCYEIIDNTDERANDGHLIYVAKCMYCGEIVNGTISNLVYNAPKTCSHKRKYIDLNTQFSTNCEHFSNNRLRIIFNSMLLRCYNKNNKSYKFYGEKGIGICEEWLKNPKLFENWAMSNGYNDDLTIDRIISTEDYSPENCRWITNIENAKWKSTTNIISINGITDSGIGWSKRLGFGKNYINTYIRKYGIDKAIEFINNNLNK